MPSKMSETYDQIRATDLSAILFKGNYKNHIIHSIFSFVFVEIEKKNKNNLKGKYTWHIANKRVTFNKNKFPVKTITWQERKKQQNRCVRR